MKQYLIIIAVIVAVAAIALGAIFFIGRNSGNGTGAQTGITGTLPPVSTSTPIGASTTAPASAPTGTTFSIGTQGGTVTVNNFYQHPAYITQDQQTVVVGQNAQYSIIYNVADSSFGITLLSLPFDAARQAAEAAFLAQLGVSKQDACKLSVYEGMPASISDQYVGKTFSLSFCGTSAPSTSWQ